MPIYAFECEACGHQFDRLQKLSDPDPSACPSCAAGEVRRQITAPAFRLSGSGWYETDFKKDGDKKRNLVEKGEGTKSEGTKSESAKSESTKSESKSQSAAAPAASAPAASSSSGSTS